MIPKKIHYCWFGGKPLPESAKIYIDSWKKYMPDYEIIEWNETNFDYSICQYVRQAYINKKWAFVSDFARFWILYEYGGIYLDTDVELIASIDDIITKGQYLGCENDFGRKSTYGEFVAVNTGLGFALEPGSMICKEMIDWYMNSNFIKENGSFDLENNVVSRLTSILVKHGFNNRVNEKQFIMDINIYPIDYFCPLNYYTNDLMITANTRTIHHYSATWLNKWEKRIEKIKAKYNKTKIGKIYAKVLIFPLRVINKLYNHRIKEN